MMNHPGKNFLAAVAAMAAISIPALVSAAGIQVSPSRLDVTVPAGRTAQRELVVANPTPDVQLFTLSADDFTGSIKPNPASFTLEAGGRKTVTVAITGSDRGALSTTISVIGKPLVDTRLQTNTGVKIPITVTIGQWKPKPWQIAATAGIIIILLGSGAYLLLRRKRKRLTSSVPR